ncbi:MAG: hypothetical protein IH600_18805, partial [Bacteroidetes bacterium]|nr:hypothetical protein [Bacteroidota bacterium]
ARLSCPDSTAGRFTVQIRFPIVVFAFLFAAVSLTPPAAIRLAAQDGVQGGSMKNDSTALWRAYADTLAWRTGDTIQLSHDFVQPDGFVLAFDPPLLLDSSGTQPDSTDILIDRRSGSVRFSPRMLAAADTALRYRVVVQYRALPFRFLPSWRMRALVTRRDGGTDEDARLQFAAPSQPLNMESIFGSELEKSGYIGRGFTVGSNRDLNINSGFRLQLAGKLSDDITVTGALTDENTPIQPEGNTRTIQELDKVFINIAGRNLSATLGDFNLRYRDSEFGRYNRKLSGVLGEGRFGGAESSATGMSAVDGMGSVASGSAVSASYASLKGTWHSLQFNGIDGVQGPYRLTGRNGEQPVLVLAGTEKVYVDGVEMMRGENNDYVIEYASGELFFTPRRLVTSYSRITVDYEYAERQYVRSLVTANSSAALAGDRLSLTARYIREADDTDNPIDLEFSDDDRAVLRAAGDDATAASRSGVVFVGYDTAKAAGRGQYIRVDTLIAGNPFVVYRYAPGADSATWSLSFSFVGTGNGDYRRKTVGTFEFAGAGRGDYAPLRLLPLPRLHQLVDLQLAAVPVNDLRFSGEIGVSALDRNLFSDRDDGDDTGAAWTMGLRWTPTLRYKNDLDLNFRYRDVASTFNPIDRINDIEFNRKWDLPSAAPERERIAEGGAAWSPLAPLRLSGGFGSMQRGGFSSLRLEGGVDIARSADSSLPDLRWRIEHIASDDGTRGQSGRWLRQQGEATYVLGIATPRLRFEQEHRENRDVASDSLLFTSLAFVDVRPGVLFPEFWNMTFSADVGVRLEDVPLDGALTRQSVDLLQQYGWSLRPWHDLSSSVSVTVRDRKFSDAFRALGSKDIQTILTRAQARYMPFNGGVQTDLLYEVSTERTSRLQRVFLNVPYGQGNYEYRGDLNGNGVQDEVEFEPTRFEGDYILLTIPTDELFPVIDLKSSLRLRLRPDRILRDEADAPLWHDVLRALSSETFVRIDEKSEEENTSDIYLLRLDRFLNDSTTLRGFQNIRQDLFLFERSQAFSLRMRFDQRDGFSQFALGSERSWRRERSLRIKTQLVREIGLQADAIFLDDELRTAAASSRARDITSANLVGDFSYRPWKDVEIGFVVDSKSATDSWPTVPVVADITTLSLRSITAFPGPGRLRIEIERSTVTFNTEVERFPFELTDGRAEGTSWVWRVNFDYRLTSFMQATLSYLGRSETERAVIHTARAEVKAFF